MFCYKVHLQEVSAFYINYYEINKDDDFATYIFLIVNK